MTFEAAVQRAVHWANRRHRLLRIRPVIKLLRARRSVIRLAQRQRVLRILLATLSAVTRNDVQQMIAGVAYYGVLSLIPITFGMLQALALVLGPEQTQQWFTQLSATLLPTPFELVPSQSLSVPAVAGAIAGATGIIALVGLTWGSIRLFGAVGLIINRMWDIDPALVGGVARLREFLFMAGTALILLASSIITYMVDLRSLPYLLGSLRIIPLADVLEAQRWWSDVLTTSLSALAFLLVYRYVPEHQVRWKWAAIGGALAGIAFKLTSDGFAFILTHLAPPNLVYGSIAWLLAFLMWNFASALILAAGAAVTAYGQSIYDSDGPRTGTGWFLK